MFTIIGSSVGLPVGSRFLNLTLCKIKDDALDLFKLEDSTNVSIASLSAGLEISTA